MTIDEFVYNVGSQGWTTAAADSRQFLRFNREGILSETDSISAVFSAMASLIHSKPLTETDRAIFAFAAADLTSKTDVIGRRKAHSVNMQIRAAVLHRRRG